MTEGTQGARARIDRGANAWSLQQQIVHYAGDPWRRNQLVWALFNALVDNVMNCQSCVPGADVGVATAESDCEHFSPCSQFAATIDVPGSQVVAHVYLSSVSGSVTELSVRSSGRPRRPWSAPGDAEIFADDSPALQGVAMRLGHTARNGPPGTSDAGRAPDKERTSAVVSSR